MECPFDRNLSASTVNFLSIFTIVKLASPPSSINGFVGLRKIFSGLTAIISISRSKEISPDFTKVVYTAAKAVSRPTTPMALPGSPLFFSSQE